MSDMNRSHGFIYLSSLYLYAVIKNSQLNGIPVRNSKCIVENDLPYYFE